MRDNEKQHRNKHTFPEDIAEMIKTKPGMGPVFCDGNRTLMQDMKEARELIESGNLTEEQRRLLDENDEIIDMTAEDILNDIRDGAFVDMGKGSSITDLIVECEKENLSESHT